MEEVKYPIKYGILEVSEPIGWPIGSESVKRGYIVSKCYLVESIIKYYPSGISKNFIKVVFPYKDFYNFKIAYMKKIDYLEHQIVPQYDFQGSVYPVSVIDEYFDNYEEAKEVAVKKNQQLQVQKIVKDFDLTNSIDKEKYIELNNKFLEELALCQKYEDYITAMTQDMKLDQSAKIKKLEQK